MYLLLYPGPCYVVLSLTCRKRQKEEITGITKDKDGELEELRAKNASLKQLINELNVTIMDLQKEIQSHMYNFFPNNPFSSIVYCITCRGLHDSVSKSGWLVKKSPNQKCKSSFSFSKSYSCSWCQTSETLLCLEGSQSLVLQNSEGFLSHPSISSLSSIFRCFVSFLLTKRTTCRNRLVRFWLIQRKFTS